MSDKLSGSFILKIAGACNLNCTYCYMYNMGDTTFKGRPRTMARDVASTAIKRISEYAERWQIRQIVVALHGGEPLLVGLEWMQWLLYEIDRIRSNDLDIVVSLQTNGTLLNEAWLDLLNSNKVRLGISFDGPPEWHDHARVNHAGRGSYAQVHHSIELLQQGKYDDLEWGVLTVANPDFNSVIIYDHFLKLGIHKMDFLWPDYNHNQLPPWKAGSLANYYIDLFNVWYNAQNPTIHIRWFESVIELLLGGKPRVDALGPQALTEVVIETDGSLEPLDVLRICGDGFTQVNLNVQDSSIDDLRETYLFRMGLNNQGLLPEGCLVCPAYSVCGGGYLPHRWNKLNGFRNPSVHSQDLLSVIGHIASCIHREFYLRTAT